MEILRTEGLRKHYRQKAGLFGRTKVLKALEGVSISVDSDSVFAIVGESGCGKSTFARLVLRLTEPTGGRVLFKGKDVQQLKGEELKGFRRAVQVVFQDPFASLNPRMNVFSTLSEPLRIHGVMPKRELRDHVAGLLDTVGLKPEHMDRYPHEFSGGQRQRICIARALALAPELIVADEPLSALDVSIQAQILNLLAELKEERKLSFIFISHDLNVVHYFADIVAVMYLGRIVEEATAEEIFNDPRHPYTEALLDAIPKVRFVQQRTTRRPGRGGLPELGVEPPSGCPFYPRCPKRTALCDREPPELKTVGGRKIACHLC